MPLSARPRSGSCDRSLSCSESTPCARRRTRASPCRSPRRTGRPPPPPPPTAPPDGTQTTRRVARRRARGRSISQACGEDGAASKPPNAPHARTPRTHAHLARAHTSHARAPRTHAPWPRAPAAPPSAPPPRTSRTALHAAPAHPAHRPSRTAESTLLSPRALLDAPLCSTLALAAATRRRSRTFGSTRRWVARAAAAPARPPGPHRP